MSNILNYQKKVFTLQAKDESNDSEDEQKTSISMIPEMMISHVWLDDSAREKFCAMKK